MPRTIALLTDFGLADPYVGQMKGILLSVAPYSAIVDISHQVRPQDVMQGAFFLAASRSYFPDDAIFLIVVDPGVGTKRRLLLARQNNQLFLAPDNGILSMIATRDWDLELWDVSGQTHRTAAPTFHGRDVLAPLAAQLAQGVTPDDLGYPMDARSMFRPLWSMPVDGMRGVSAHVLHVDRFGNCLLNLALSDWGVNLVGKPALHAPLLQTLAISRTYAELPEGAVGLLEGSQGYWELAVNRGSAAEVLGLCPGQEILISGVVCKADNVPSGDSAGGTSNE